MSWSMRGLNTLFNASLYNNFTTMHKTVALENQPIEILTT